MIGKTRHTLYKTWSNMIARCEIPGASRYKNYGGRGIQVCDRWRKDFWSFVSDMGEKPSKNHSLDRIDVNGNYEPSNCQWATKSDQARNTRAARIVEIGGVKYHVAELQEKYGVDMRTISYRASKGWPFEKIVSKEKHYNNDESQKKATQKHAEMKRSQTHCKNGHELTSNNVYEHNGTRSCRACRKAWDKYLYYQKQRPFSDFL